MNFLIEKMQLCHLNDICKIENECFSHPRTFDSLLTELELDCSLFYCATSDGKVLGYGGINTVLDEAYIINIAVSSEYRHMGVGRKILKSLVDYCQKNNFSFISLEVRVSNNIAISLYKQEGFSIIGERKNFYRTPTENAYIMTHYFNKY